MMLARMVLGVWLVGVLIACGGCAAFSPGPDDGGASVRVVLDDAYETQRTLSVGDVVALDLALPVESDVEVVGAAFDPDILRMGKYLLYTDGQDRRATYIFTVLAAGSTDVLIKTRSARDGSIAYYKRVIIVVEAE